MRELGAVVYNVRCDFVAPGLTYGCRACVGNATPPPQYPQTQQQQQHAGGAGAGAGMTAPPGGMVPGLGGNAGSGMYGQQQQQPSQQQQGGYGNAAASGYGQQAQGQGAQTCPFCVSNFRETLSIQSSLGSPAANSGYGQQAPGKGV